MDRRLVACLAATFLLFSFLPKVWTPDSRAYLRNQAVGHWEAEDAGDKGGAAEEKEVPVEATRLLEGVLSGLGRDATDVLRMQSGVMSRHNSHFGHGYFTYMVIVEEKHHQEPKRGSDEDPLDLEVPEVYQPSPGLRGMEGVGGWNSREMSACDIPADMREAYPKNGAELKSGTKRIEAMLANASAREWPSQGGAKLYGVG